MKRILMGLFLVISTVVGHVKEWHLTVLSDTIVEQHNPLKEHFRAEGEV